MSNSVLLQGDCLEVLKELPDNSVDSLITDPPAGIAFMGKSWDEDKGGRKQWIAWMSEVMTECLRVLKPGAHGLVWALPRTSHWTGQALEDAGFEIRDTISHVFGSGFPKSLNISKAIEGQFECQFSSAAKNAEKLLGLFQVELREEKTGSVLGHVAIQPEGEQGRLMVIGRAVDSSGQTVTFQLESTELTSLSIDTLCKHTLADPSNPQKRFITLTKLKMITDSKILNLLPSLNTLANTQGAGTALKPAHETWWLVRKPCSEKTVAANVLLHGTGGLNIDASRIGTTEKLSQGASNLGFHGVDAPVKTEQHSGGRFPANLIFSHNHDCVEVGTKQIKTNSGSTNIKGNSSHWKDGNKFEGSGYGREQTVSAFECTPGCAVAELDRQSGVTKEPLRLETVETMGYHGGKSFKGTRGHGDSGGASRFFYCAKASKKDKNGGLEGETKKHRSSDARPNSGDFTGKFPDHDHREKIGNFHPTVKSTALMSYLIKMITPPNGLVLDPFTGSGSTGVAAVKNGFAFIGIEKEQEYYDIAEKRIESAATRKPSTDKDDSAA